MTTRHMRVMLVHDGQARTANLRDGLASLNMNVIAEVEACLGLDKVINALMPDVVLIDAGAPSRDTLEAVCVASQQSMRPMVMFTGDGSRETIKMMLNSGISAYVVGNVDIHRLNSIFQVAEERFALEKSRREQLAESQEKLNDRARIDEAKTLLMEMRAMTEEDAYKWLRSRAMQTQRKISEVARELIEVTNWCKPPSI